MDSRLDYNSLLLRDSIILRSALTIKMLACVAVTEDREEGSKVRTR